MKSLIKTLFFAICLGHVSQAESLKGFYMTPNQKVFEMKSSVERYKLHGKELLILFAVSPSFYRFPMETLTVEDLKKFLDPRIQKEKKILVKFDPITRQILSLKDVE